MGMNNAAINGLCLNANILARATSGFQVVSSDQACPRHFGLFFESSHAKAYADACDAEAAAAGSSDRFVVKAWKKAARRR